MKGLKLNTPVEFPGSKVRISCRDRIMILGSCFADNIGSRLAQRQFDVCVNPFGTLYNPASAAESIERLDSGRHFSVGDCVQIGSCCGRWGSFHHHTLAARDTREAFLSDANAALDKASEFWKGCGKVIITLGTSWCFRHVCRMDGKGREEAAEDHDEGFIVANCLKRDAREFRREFLPAAKTAELLREIVDNHPEKEFIFTVSPIRHFKDGAHGNQLSKASLLLGVDGAIRDNPRCEYFPAYEIMLDELRDYRFYAEDMLHPSGQAADYLFSRFIDWALPAAEEAEFEARDKAFRQSRHIDRTGI